MVPSLLLQINGTEWFNNIAWITGQNSSDSLVNTWFQSKHSHFAFQQAFSVGGASWIFDPSKEAVKCKKKHTSNKFAI